MDSTAAAAPDATPSLKERQRQKRAALILEVAEQVLAEKGYHNTSMEEIAARVGIAKGTIYLHYPSKEALVVALFARELSAFQQAVAAAAGQEAPPRARLEAILRHAYVGAQSDRQHLLWSLFVSADIPRTAYEKQLAPDGPIARITASIRAVLEEGKRAGEFDASIPTDVMLSVFLDLLSVPQRMRLMQMQQLSADDLVTYVSRSFFQGISAAGARP
ncbi:MAG: helix-turn-helix domain-containing protein [Chloroflexota bacterium]|nr:MAG: TetR/AcrR family transcriptional regulator [Chloroflexota bacterium]